MGDQKRKCEQKEIVRNVPLFKMHTVVFLSKTFYSVQVPSDQGIPKITGPRPPASRGYNLNHALTLGCYPTVWAFN